MMTWTKTFSVIVFILFSFSLEFGNNVSAQSDSVGATASKRITPWSYCDWINNRNGLGIFVPYRTENEWISFRNNAPGKDVTPCGAVSWSSGSYTFTVPTGVTSIYVVAVGGGGGGGGSSAGNYGWPMGGGGGGGGAGQVTSGQYGVSPGQTLTVYVGAGGAGGLYTAYDSVAGSNGGASGVSGLISAEGGQGGGGGISVYPSAEEEYIYCAYPFYYWYIYPWAGPYCPNSDYSSPVGGGYGGSSGGGAGTGPDLSGYSYGGAGGSSSYGSGGAGGTPYSSHAGGGGIGAGGGGGGSSGYSPNDTITLSGAGGGGYVYLAW